MIGREIISPQELEELCSLFFDGQLNREEEQALRTILTRHDLQKTDGIIAEAVFVMGIERATGKRVTAVKPSRMMLSGAFRRIATASVAAAVMIGCISAIWYFVASDVNPIDTAAYIVYCNGVRIDDPAEAKRIALANYNAQLARMEKLQHIQNEIIEKLETENAYADRMLLKASVMVESN